MVVLVVWLGWLLFSSPSLEIAEASGEVISCQPIVRQVKSYPVSPYSVDDGGVISDYAANAGRNIIGNDRNEHEQVTDAAAYHAADVIIASCGEARANRRTEASVVMLAIAVVAIPTLSRRTSRKTTAAPGGKDDQD